METELRRLLRQIDAEYEAASSGLHAFADGTARHTFINARMENIDRCRVELTTLVGEKEAMRLMIEAE